MPAAVIVIDVQDSFRHRPNWMAMEPADVVERVVRLVTAARRSGTPVLWVLHSEPGTGGPFDPATGQVRLLPGLEPTPGETVLTKTTINSFTSTDLAERLDVLGVTELVVCGLQTEQCCETTTRLAADLGYAVTFVLDATATFPVAAPGSPDDRPITDLLADPGTLSAGAVVERTGYVLDRRFAAVRSLAQVLASHPALTRHRDAS